MAPPVITVIVPAHDAQDAVDGLLDALAAQTVGREAFEVVVVDDGSTDGTAATALAHALAPRVLRRAARGGSYAARNDALAQATTSLLAFTDADCRPEPRWLEEALARVGAASETLLAGHVDVPLRSRPSLAEALDVARFLDQERAVGLGFAATANLIAPRAAFDRAGVFDARLRSGGDLEWCSRATAAGFELLYAPEVRVVHLPRTRPRALARKAFRVGVGVGQMRRHGVGPWGERPRMWASPGAWRAPRALLGEERLARAGHLPARRRRRALLAGQYALVHLPMLAGSAVGELRG